MKKEIIWEMIEKKRNVTALFEGIDEHSGNAVYCNGRTMSYEELSLKSRTIAAALQKRGIGPGKTVMIALEAEVDLFCAIVGAGRTGAILSIVDITVPQERMERIKESVGFDMILNREVYVELLGEGNLEEYRKISDQIAPEDIFSIFFTSGSTGTPKGVQWMQRNPIACMIDKPYNSILVDVVKSSDIILGLGHPSYTFGTLILLYTLFYGREFAYIRPGCGSTLEEIRTILGDKEKRHLLAFTPSATKACLQDASVRAVMNHCSGMVLAGEPMPQSLLDELRDVLTNDQYIINCYGITEAIIVSARKVYGKAEPDNIGKPMAGSRVWICDEDKKELPPGEPGEICIQGPNIVAGYLNAEQENAEKFILRHRSEKNSENTCYTGDFGYLDEEGNLHIIGRIDRMIKNMGFRLDPSEIEECLKKYAGVREAVVKQIDTGDQKLLCAFYEGEKKSTKEFVQAIAARLPHYMMPHRFCYRDKIPVTDRGKLEFRQLTLTESDLDTEIYEAPANETEKEICKAFQAILLGDDSDHLVGRYDNYFYLGGDSLKGMKVLECLGQAGLYYTVSDLFYHPTPQKLAAVHRSFEKKKEDIEIPLPTEIEVLCQDQNVERIYQADIVSEKFIFMDHLKLDHVQNSICTRMTINRKFSEKEFYEKVKLLKHNHPALRSKYVRDNRGIYWQVFYKLLDSPVYYKDLNVLKKDILKQEFIQGFRKVFSEDDALFKIACFPTDEKHSVVLLEVSHSLMDGASVAAVMKELAAPEVKENMDSYYDFKESAFLGRRCSPKEVRDYYQEAVKLKPLMPVLLGSVKEVKTIRLQFDCQVSEQIMTYCKKNHLSVYSYMQYCFAKSLLKASGQDEIWFYAYFSGRDARLKESIRMVGNLMYRIPVKITRTMDADALQRAILMLQEHPYISYYQMMGRFSLLDLVDGLNYLAFDGDDNYSAEFMEDKNVVGNRLKIEDGCILIELRFHAGDGKEALYRKMEEEMHKLAEGGQPL